MHCRKDDIALSIKDRKKKKGKKKQSIRVLGMKRCNGIRSEALHIPQVIDVALEATSGRSHG